LAPETFAVEEAISEVCSVIAPTAKKKGISVKASLTPHVDSVTLDQQRFKQILYNLLSNAVKFTGDGGTIELVTDRKDPDKFMIKIKDTGIGISSEDMPKLFSEFTQLDSSTGRRYEGTGLGLALTKKIVELQGGNISVESKLGAGTTFNVVLPLSLGR